jgi:hypothetical protein
MVQKPCTAVIKLDVRDSSPDWEPYEQPNASASPANVLFPEWDDTGFGGLEPFGSPIEVPNKKRLTDSLLRSTQMAEDH